MLGAGWPSHDTQIFPPARVPCLFAHRQNPISSPPRPVAGMAGRALEPQTEHLMTQHSMNDNSEQPQKPGDPAASAPASTGPSFAAAESTIRDLSGEIATAIERAPGETVRCRRISGDRYRCNWWAPLARGDAARGASAGLLITTQRVVKSRLLHVTRSREGLVIETDEAQ
jgi:hypothetical protein